MVKIKENTDLNQIFLEANVAIVEIIEDRNSDLIAIQPGFDTTMRKTIYKDQILSEIYKGIMVIDFALIVAATNSTSYLEDDNGKKHKVSDDEKKTIIVENLLNVSEMLGFSLVIESGIVYLFNGCYYGMLEYDKMKTFLGEVAGKSGISIYKARGFKFTIDLYRQFCHSAAILDVKYDDIIKINMLNGTLHLQENVFEIKEYQKEDFFKYQLSFNYDPEAKAPLFERFLNKVLPDISTQNVLMEYLGYVLTKNMKLEKILILYGGGSNGKSVLFDIINALFGDENVSTTAMSNLCDNSGYYRPPLASKLLNYSSEHGGKLQDIQIYKKLISGEPVDGRLPHAPPVTVKDYCKFIINSNNLPNVEQSHAYFRRHIVIPFKVTIKDSDRDIHLAQKIIKNELSGVLNLILLGLKRLIAQDGFSESLEINQEIDKYKLESNTVSQFLEEEGWGKSKINKTVLKKLYEDYEIYCRESNLMYCSKPSFTKRLKELDFTIQYKGTNNLTYVFCQQKGDSTEVLDSTNINNINNILDIFKK